ncbi:MAG: glycosyltransferase [Phycisphaeraceae bacterium]|nr:glycosyltransferase [Phycisphaeraceae bacterium]
MSPRIAYILPTRNRPRVLSDTLAALGALPPHDAQIIVVDNASSPAAEVLPRLQNGVDAHLIRLEKNLGAASRNVGARAADTSVEWLVMLDDDSQPADLGFLEALRAAPGDVLAVSADIFLPRVARRESGGLPEVFIGCGVAIRRDAFVELDGYDPSFNYYAEEYDLAARLLMRGGRVMFEPRFRVLHHKVEVGRDMDLILERLVRNNGWVIQRFAPELDRRAALRTTRSRYRAIAHKERALAGFAGGLRELRETIRAQRRTPMPPNLWDRFTGLAHAREALHAHWGRRRFATASIIDPGKGVHLIERALAELGVDPARDPGDAEALVIGTLSPGPMLDAFEQARPGRVIAPWLGAGFPPFSTGRRRAG